MLKSLICYFMNHNLLKLKTFLDYTSKRSCSRCGKTFHVDRIGIITQEWDNVLESIYKNDNGPYYEQSIDWVG